MLQIVCVFSTEEPRHKTRLIRHVSKPLCFETFVFRSGHSAATLYRKLQLDLVCVTVMLQIAGVVPRGNLGRTLPAGHGYTIISKSEPYHAEACSGKYMQEIIVLFVSSSSSSSGRCQTCLQTRDRRSGDRPIGGPFGQVACLAVWQGGLGGGYCPSGHGAAIMGCSMGLPAGRAGHSMASVGGALGAPGRGKGLGALPRPGGCRVAGSARRRLEDSGCDYLGGLIAHTKNI